MGFAHKKANDKAVGHRSRNALVVVPQHTEAPPCPGGLLVTTQRVWEAFWTSPVANAIDRRSDLPRLERWICALDEYERARRQFRANRLVTGSTGQPVLNPLASYMSSLEAQIRATETDFGMTPMARLRLGIAVGEAARSLAELNAETDDDDATDFDPRAAL